MTDKAKKIHLIHGDCDYLIFKEMQSLKKNLIKENINITEFNGKRDLRFDDIFNALHSSDLFMPSSTVIIRDITDSRSFFGFVEELIKYIDSDSEMQNDLYIFNFGKVTKVSRIYKIITKHGIVKEITVPKPAELLKLIKQSINITDSAAETLIKYSNSDLFLIKNEISKLKNYLLATNKEKIDVEDVEKLCIKSLDTNDIWSVGEKLINYIIDKDPNTKLKLLNEVDYLLENNTATMQILYSFYQYVLNGIKLKQAVKQGKSFKECLSFGYFFTKEFYPKAKSLSEEELFEINKQLLGYEYGLKSGQVEESLGLKNFLICI